MKTEKFLQLTMGILLLCCVVKTGWAEDVINFGDRTPTVEEIVKGLSGEYKSAPSDPSDQSKLKTISMEIVFERNSFKLTPKAKKTLKAVAESFNTPLLQNKQFIIEGHTDASGDDAYNMELSRKRAEAVKYYLVTEADIKPDRLKTVGKGENELLFKDKPFSPKNRRVQFRTIESAKNSN